MGKKWKQWQILYSWAPKSLGTVTAVIKLRHLLFGEKSYDKIRQHIKKQRHHFADTGLSSQRYDFSTSHVWMWELDHKEDWVPKNGCFLTVVIEKTLENSLDCKEIKPVNPKRNQPWIFIGRMDAEAETPILRPPDVKSQHTGKDPDAGKDWRQKEKRAAEDEMVRQHHRFNGHEPEQILGDSGGQGSLACSSPWVTESDMTEGLNWTTTNWSSSFLWCMFKMLEEK